MSNKKNSILLICVIISVVLLWSKVESSDTDSNEEQNHSIEQSDEDFDDMIDLYRRASLRPVIVYPRASLRPFNGKRASLRPFGKRASLRPFGKRASLRPTGKRASLRPVNYIGARKRRSVMFNDE